MCWAVRDLENPTKQHTHTQKQVSDWSPGATIKSFCNGRSCCWHGSSRMAVSMATVASSALGLGLTCPRPSSSSMDCLWPLNSFILFQVDSIRDDSPAATAECRRLSIVKCVFFLVFLASLTGCAARFDRVSC